MGISVITQKRSRQAPSRSSTSAVKVYACQMNELVVSHRKAKGQTLRLAVWYKIDHPKNLYLFEIVDGFPNGNGDSELFTVEFGGSDKFPIARQGKLYLTLVNSDEALTAFKESWRGTPDIRSSLLQGSFSILFQDKRGTQRLNQILSLHA